MAKDSRLERAGVSGYNDYKVYVHQKKTDGSIFYVGKGRRWRENQKSNRNKHWHNVVNKHDFSVCVVAANLTNEEACNFEKILINKLGFDTLVNYTLGGEGSEGYRHNEETLSKMKGRKLSEEHRKKLSEAKKKNPTRYWLGKKRSQNTKNKIKNKKSDPMLATVEKMLLKNIDRKTIKNETKKSLAYIRGVANRLRNKGYELERLKN
jgi:hypothetical protein